jgi:hypothetical protein
MLCDKGDLKPKRTVKCAQGKNSVPKSFKVGPKNLQIKSLKCAQTENRLQKNPKEVTLTLPQ